MIYHVVLLARFLGHCLLRVLAAVAVLCAAIGVAAVAVRVVIASRVIRSSLTLLPQCLACSIIEKLLA